MKTIQELKLGYTDAQNYNSSANKNMFNEVFVKNSYLCDLLNPSCYFLIGEKGTGKTAYATFLSNNDYHENRSFVKFLSATDYEKFYTLKKTNNLDLSGYANIWKIILMLLLAKKITETPNLISRHSKGHIKSLIKAIDDYYSGAFSPEIIQALRVIDDSQGIAKVFCNIAEAGIEVKKTIEASEVKFQTNLFYIERQFSDAIKKLKLEKNINLFIDGIDVRPDVIPYNDYIECIRGLTNAAWFLNTDLFQNVKDSIGYLKVVLLLRPDIYNSLNLQNSTNKLLDNSVFLDWRTTYNQYENSELYKVASRILSYGQESIKSDSGDIWESYFPWKIKSTNEDREYDTAFMSFLKISLSRPRDILAILEFLKRIMVNNNHGKSNEFIQTFFNSDEFQNTYSEYFMSSLKDQLSFYYSDADFEHFIKFFDFFDEKEFNYSQYLTKYESYIDYILENAKEIPAFVEKPEILLQVLYDSNIITAIDKGGHYPYFYFSYREKTSSNIRPKVLIAENINYRFHYGMYKKNKFGRF